MFSGIRRESSTLGSSQGADTPGGSVTLVEVLSAQVSQWKVRSRESVVDSPVEQFL